MGQAYNLKKLKSMGINCDNYYRYQSKKFQYHNNSSIATVHMIIIKFVI